MELRSTIRMFIILIMFLSLVNCVTYLFYPELYLSKNRRDKVLLYLFNVVLALYVVLMEKIDEMLTMLRKIYEKI